MSLIGANNEEKIWNFLKTQGLSDCGVAGLMGNLYAESALNPTNLQNTYEKKFGMTDAEYTAAVDSGKYANFVRDSAGYGLAQWTYWSRKQALLDHVKAAGKSIGDLEAQLDYLIKELGSYGLLNTMKSVKSVREASNVILLQFEKPASKDTKETQDRRAGYSQTYYDKYAGKTTATVSAPVATAPQKEGSPLKLVQSILTKNPCYTGGRKITVKGLMLHSVGCPQPRASVFINNWNSPSYDRACVHGFIDANDGTVYQTLPWNHRGWHAGGSANNTHIGVEMCEPACIKYTGGSTFTCSDKASAQAATKRTYEAAVQLFAMLCKEFSLNPLADGVIISHKEGCSRGVASNHGDPEHLWSQLNMGYTMNGFRQDVKAAMAGVTVTTTPAVSSGTASTAVSYTVRIEANDLNIRINPDKNSQSKGYIKPGVYTIVAESDGPGASKWGKLKSGAGWVSLDYCTKLGAAAPTKTISEADQAIDKLAKLGVINSPDYWKKTVGTVQFLDQLFIKAAAKITGVGPRSVSVMAGVEQLVKDGIINTPSYWLEHHQDCPNLGALLCALGGAKKG